MAPEIHVSRLVRVAFGLALAATIVTSAVLIVTAVGGADNRGDITDFHAFTIAGRLIWSGQFDQAYHASAMLARETALGGGRPVFMPWSYPPLFGVVVAGLAALPLGPAFLLFTAATLGLYLWAMGRLDRDGRWPVMLASTTSIVLNLRCGQNGLLTAGLVALAASFLLAARPVRAGLCLALMAIKPHLIPLLPIGLLAQRRWRTLGVAAAGALALTGLSVAIFGTPVFAAFLRALPDVGRLMAVGAYPLHRMTSIFAFGMSLGLPAWAATLLHAAVALAVLSAVARLAARRPDPRLGLGLAVMAGFFVSPYVYDYDLVLFGVGLLLVSPALRLCVTPRHHVAILAGCALTQSMGLVLNPFADQQGGVIVSPAGPLLLALLCGILRPLWGGKASERMPDPSPAACGPTPSPGTYRNNRFDFWGVLPWRGAEKRSSYVCGNPPA